MIRKYNREFQTNSLLDVELWAFKNRLTPDQGGLGRARHFKNICLEIWPDFVFYEWTEEQAEALCENDITGFTSGASSSKSAMLAKYGLASWYSAPVDTLVVVCSTTSTDAKKRIWAEIVASHRKARAAKKAVGHLVETQAIIKLSEKTDAFAASDNSSISLIAAGNEERNNALERLQGFKNKNVLILLDELQNCSQEIIEFAIWNLNANPHWEVHAAGNADSRFDAHGMYMTPTEGWNSVNRTTHKWKIRVGGKEGIALHFDATSEDSPNMKRFTQGVPQLPFLRKAEDSLAALTLLGAENKTFLRQFAGFWPPAEGETDFIYTDAAISANFGNERAVWKTPPSEFAGIDPSYSSGGDRFVFSHLRYGLSEFDIWIVEFYEDILIRPKLAKGETKDDGAVRECKRICEEREIPARHVGMDASAGTALLSIMHRQWSPEILGVQFGGKPTDLPVSQFDKRIASDIYANAASELWYVGVEFLNAGQLRGLRPDRIKELVARKYEHVAGDKVRIESKPDMKKRLGFSPDIADAGFVGLRVIRERMKVVAGASTPAAQRTGGDWKAVMKRSDVVSRSAHDFAKRLRVRLG